MNKNKRLKIKIMFIILLGFPIFLSGLYVNNAIPIKNHSEITDDRFNEGCIEFDIKTPNLDVEEIKVATGEVYHRVSINESSSLGQVGYPKIPFKTIKVLLPYGKDLEDVIIEPGSEKVIEGTYKIEPAQAPLIFGSCESTEFNIKQSVYESAETYPEKFYSIEGIHKLRGYRILILNVFPVRYVPKTGKLSYFQDVKVSVNLRGWTMEDFLYRGCGVDEERVLNVVINPEDVYTYREGLKSERYLLKTSTLPPASYDYVIITNEALKNSAGLYTFQDLASLKNSKGIKTTIVTTEEIYANYTGVDDQTKIRNFIIDAYQNWGIEYVLLGGDSDGQNFGGESEDPIIPSRGFHYCCYAPIEREDNIPSDLYYAALDGSWNDDGDNLWGEPGEDDLYAEVYVGRAPVDSENELSNFINKTLTHEESDDSYLAKALMVGEFLGYDWPAQGGEYMDEIKNGSSVGGYCTAGFPDSYNVSTLYDRDYYPSGWNKNDLIPLLNNGVHIISHLGHSSVDWNMKLSNSDVDNLINDKYFFLYTQGCYPGAFDNRDSLGDFHDYDCIVEHYITNPHGAFAVIANSRFGVGRAIDTNSPSQHLNREFFDAVFRENIKELGKANQDSKEDSIGSLSQQYMRYCYYEVTLFGDPTTSFFSEGNTEEPTLSNEVVSQVLGFQNTPINFSIVYTDIENNAPSYINANINGTVIPMEKQDPTDIDYTDGCIYQVSTYIQPASHNYSYYFRCSDGEYSVSTSSFNNVKILYSNDHSPTLLGGQVNPEKGSFNLTEFEYSVVYTDVDNNEPEYINVMINSTIFPLTKQDPLDFNYMDGCFYVYKTKLAELGMFTYHFSCSDGESSGDDGPFSGPIVSEAIPFDGMYLNYTIMSEGIPPPIPYPMPYIVSYSHDRGAIFNVTLGEPNKPPQYTYSVDANTRIFYYPVDYLEPRHSSFWIFKDVSLGDFIYISKLLGNDIIASVSSDIICDIPGIGLIEVWVLRDVTSSDTFLWYDKNTGILVNGSFYYDDITFVNLELLNTNVIMSTFQDLAPNTNFTATKINIIEGESVQFNFTGDEGNDPATYMWDFGDGHVSTEQNPEHRYDTPGSYNVTLTLNDHFGDIDIEIKEDYIIVNEDIVPLADFAVNETIISENGTISFTFNGSIGNGPATYIWDFGDGSNPSYEQNPVHQYMTPGIYSVLLIITDSNGDFDHILYTSLIIVKDTEIPPFIPGYDMILIMWAISIVSVIIIIRNRDISKNKRNS